MGRPWTSGVRGTSRPWRWDRAGHSHSVKQNTNRIKRYRDPRGLYNIWITWVVVGQDCDQQPMKMRQVSQSSRMLTRFRLKTFRDPEADRVEVWVDYHTGHLQSVKHNTDKEAQAEEVWRHRCRQRHSEIQEQRHSETQEQTETEIQKHTETFRDPEADRDVRRSRSKQKHSEIQEWTAWRIEQSTIVSQAEYR